MRIFPDAPEGRLERVGRALLLLAAVALGVGLVAAAWRGYQLTVWTHVQGQVVRSQVIRTQNGSGVMMCSTEFEVQYPVGTTTRSFRHKDSSSSSDCAAWERRAAALPGWRMAVLYNPSHPDDAYPYGGRTVGFFAVALVMACLAVLFGITGAGLQWLGCKLAACGCPPLRSARPLLRRYDRRR
jgi:hypothetical protein